MKLLQVTVHLTHSLTIYSMISLLKHES